MLNKLPMHPIVSAEDNCVRFRPNLIVQYLLDNGGIDMNQIARQGFPAEDSTQFAQLIGYSVSGFGELSYVNDADYATAQNIVERPELTEQESRIQVLEATIEAARKGVGIAVEALFRVCAEDLQT